MKQLSLVYLKKRNLFMSLYVWMPVFFFFIVDSLKQLSY